MRNRFLPWYRKNGYTHLLFDKPMPVGKSSCDDPSTSREMQAGESSCGDPSTFQNTSTSSNDTTTSGISLLNDDFKVNLGTTLETTKYIIDMFPDHGNTLHLETALGIFSAIMDSQLAEPEGVDE